jgi:hypothetical protein
MLTDLGKLPASGELNSACVCLDPLPPTRMTRLSGIGRAHRMKAVACLLCADARSFGWELGIRTNGRDILRPYQ